MPNTFFHALGCFIYRRRSWVIISWLLCIALCVPSLPNLMKPFNSSGFENFKSESFVSMRDTEKNIGYQKNRILILFQKIKNSISDQQFRKDVDKSLKGLDDLSEKHEVIVGPVHHHKNILAILAYKQAQNITSLQIDDIESKINLTKRIKMNLGGADVFIQSINKQTQKDLFRSDLVAAPVTIITLLLVFGSITAAFMPILVGASCTVIMLAFLHQLAYHVSLSIFTINIATLLGLCLSLDYALFIISRFREELIAHTSIEEAIARTMTTAGKAVFFSGLAVFASLSALLIFPINILVSVGIGGLSAVLLAVFGALTLLPAILSCLKQQINWGTLFKIKVKESTLWRRIANQVTHFPYLFACLGIVMLVICSYPIKHIQLGIYDYHILPEQSEGRDFFKSFTKHYQEEEMSPIMVVVTTSSKLLNERNIKKVFRLVTKLKNLESVEKVSGYLSWIPRGKLTDYQMFYTGDKDRLPESVKQILTTSTNKHTAVLYVQSQYKPESKQTKQLIREIRDISIKGLTIQVTGEPANNLDVFDGIYQQMPYAIAWILGVTFIVLLILLKSLFLPFKAISMNILSLLATYGSLVFIFQEGHLHEWLNFDPQGSLDISMLVIIFCALFGFSMDYEVFLLTRIQECYYRTHDNNSSIIFGIEHSAKIITSAAWIVIVLCASFLVADVLMVKAFGFGIAIAIFLDAFIIRIFLVPAIMTLTHKINWYIPQFLKKVIGNHQFVE
jgi:RND superfamily putative drug exporter